MLALKPLACAACGAAVPLGIHKTVRCHFCRAETEIPDEYRAAQRAAIEFGENRALAVELYGRVGRPPTRMALAIQNTTLGVASTTQRIGGIVLAILLVNPWIGVPVVLVGAYYAGYPLVLAFRGVMRIAGRPYHDPIPAGPVFILLSILLTFGIGIPLVRFARERELGPVRASIHASLAARMPEKPGGPSCCRTCGAALDVPAGALGVPCVYCKADNLVALPAAWVSRIRSGEFEHFMSIDGALNAFRLASERARERLWRLWFWYVIAFPVLVCAAFALNDCRY